MRLKTLQYCLVFALFSDPANAQVQNCRSNSLPIMETVSLSELVGRGGGADGGGGIDTLVLPGPTFFVPRPVIYQSLERIDLQNGLFDTVVLVWDFIETTEEWEVEVLADPFDQVIVDPRLDWNRSVDAAFTGQVLTATRQSADLRVRANFDVHIIAPSSDVFMTREGPAGQFQLTEATGTAGLPIVEEGRLEWTEPGIVTPNLDAAQSGSLVIDTMNRRSNLIGIDLAWFEAGVSRSLHLEADEIDRVVLMQPDCWTLTTDDQGTSMVRHLDPAGGMISISASPRFLQPYRTRPLRVASAGDFGLVRHLSADVSGSVDEIDLRNGSHDTLIMRNANLRIDVPLVIAGDPGLDEIWIEGTAGWTFDYQDFGIVLRSPRGPENEMTIAFQPGLAVRILPPPPYLTDPSMANLPFYPGISDEIREGGQLFVTRLGIVRFSTAQLQNRVRLMFENGAANTVYFDFDEAINGEERVTLFGDQGRDRLVISGRNRHSINTDGAFVWRLERDDGSVQMIEARGFASVAYVD